ncbi:MAG: hypothetical protein WBO93_08660 [Gammaproteobacteria bacterium]
MKTLPATVIAVMSIIADVSAQQTVPSLPDTFPETFPGSGGFPEPAQPSGLPPAYPEWPERPVRREMIPPPPAGPYMSSALSEIDAFPADTGGLSNEFRQPQTPWPFFDTEMHWPDIPERGVPEVWVPESGEYRFVPEEVERQLDYPVRSNRPWPVYQQYPGYRPMPPVRRPDYGYR